MSRAYLIEIEHEAIGILVREATSYRFFMTNRRFLRLDRTEFKSAKQAYYAAIMLAGRKDVTRSGLTPMHTDAFNPPPLLFV